MSANVPWEAHVTVRDDDVERWRTYCADRSDYYGTEIKPLYIELSAGEHPRQLMFAYRWEGKPEYARDRLDDIVTDVEREGFQELRAKLECPLDKSGELNLPRLSRPYAECHMKLMLPADTAAGIVAKACDHADVHASRNLLADQGELQKWYLTLRDHRGDMGLAAFTFNYGLALVQEVVPAVRMEMEFVVHDSNPALDEGWA